MIEGTILGQQIKGDQIERHPKTYYVWVKCPDCDYIRWVARKSGEINQPLNTIRRCKECSLKIQAFNFRLPGSR